jgi:hypothetical protein
MSWKDDLPEPLRDAPFIAKAESLEDAVKHIQHAANHVGSSIRLPDKSATDEQMNEFASKVLERFPNLMLKPGEDDLPPDDPDKYVLPEDQAPYIDYDTARQEAKEAGLSRKQFERIYGTRAQYEQQAREQHEQSIASLQKEWGKAFDDKVENIRRFAEESGAPPTLVEAIEQGRLDAPSLKWLSRWADATQETARNSSRDTTSTTRLTPAEAEEKIYELMNNPAMWDSNDPRHAGLMKRRMELEFIAHSK